MSGVGATKKAETAKKKGVAGKFKAKAKTTLSIDYVGSSVTHAQLSELHAQGLLPSQESIWWRPPLKEIWP